MSWNNVPKPNTQTYINTNPVGKEQYDQASLQYDDINVFYDGINPDQWAKVSKPQGYGFLTWADMTMMWNDADWQWGSSADNWTKVPKPI